MVWRAQARCRELRIDPAQTSPEASALGDVRVPRRHAARFYAEDVRRANVTDVALTAMWDAVSQEYPEFKTLTSRRTRRSLTDGHRAGHYLGLGRNPARQQADYRLLIICRMMPRTAVPRTTAALLG